MMTNEELADALDGLYAYDTGSVDSGIHDEGLRARCIARLAEMGETKAEGFPISDDAVFLSRFIRDRALSEDAMKQGYGIEDVAEFIQWLAERMDLDLI